MNTKWNTTTNNKIHNNTHLKFGAQHYKGYRTQNSVQQQQWTDIA